MAMTKEARKKLIILIIVAVVLLSPLILLSGWSMSYMEEKAIANPTEDWASSLQLTCAKAYRLTLRRAEERAAYERYYKYFTTRPERGLAKYMIAACMEKDLTTSRRRTIEAYEDFLYEFEDDPLFQQFPNWQFYVREAERAIDRIRNNPT